MTDTRRDDEIELAMVGDSASAQRQERSDAAANRILILRTAEKLFAARGVAEVNMADIAQAAGVGKGTLRHVVEPSLDQPLYWQYVTVNALLAAAVDDGEVSPELDVDYMTEALLAPLTADAFRFQRRVRGFTLDRISAGLCQLVDALSLAD